MYSDPYYEKLRLLFVERLKGIKEVFTLASTNVCQNADRYMKGAKNKVDEELLSYYEEEWDKYAASASCCNRLFAFMNRHWVAFKRTEGNTSIHTVGKVSWDIETVIF